VSDGLERRLPKGQPRAVSTAAARCGSPRLRRRRAGLPLSRRVRAAIAALLWATSISPVRVTPSESGEGTFGAPGCPGWRLAAGRYFVLRRPGPLSGTLFSAGSL